jgi:hypothetical protein
MKLALGDDFRAQPALVPFVLDQQSSVGLETRAHFRNPIGAVRRARSSPERRRPGLKTNSFQAYQSYADEGQKNRSCLKAS